MNTKYLNLKMQSKNPATVGDRIFVLEKVSSFDRISGRRAPSLEGATASEGFKVNERAIPTNCNLPRNRKNAGTV